jgi:dihydroorotase (multifunctional complex type)
MRERDREPSSALKIFLGSSTGSLLVKDFAPLYGLFSSWQSSKPVTVHGEDEDAVKFFTEKVKEEKKSDATASEHNKCRPPVCAEMAVKRAISIAAETGRRLHVCHASTAGELEAVRQAKKAGLQVTCEAAPHHMFLCEDDTKKLKNFGKMNPPLRSKEDVAAVWNAVADGTVDCVATDHAPHSREEKEKDYWDAPSGVPGLETMLPLLLDAVNAKKIGLERLGGLCCASPAKIFGLKGKGGFAVGGDADFTLVDLKGETKVDGSRLFTKCKWSPWEGKTLKGRVWMLTWLSAMTTKPVMPGSSSGLS